MPTFEFEVGEVSQNLDDEKKSVGFLRRNLRFLLVLKVLANLSDKKIV